MDNITEQASGFIKGFFAAAGPKYSITDREAKIFACLAAPESSCGSNPGNSGTGAYGVFQVLLDTHRECFNNNPTCTRLVNGPVGCPRGPNCKIAASNHACNTTAAICVLRKPPRSFQPWTTDKRGAPVQKKCIATYSN